MCHINLIPHRRAAREKLSSTNIDDLWQQVGVEFLSPSLPPWVSVGGPVWQAGSETRHPARGRGALGALSEQVSE